MSNLDFIDFPLTGSQNTAPEFAGRTVVDDYGNQFQLCLVKGSTVAAKAGGPALFYSNDSTGYTVTPDWSQADMQGSNAGCGMFMCTSLVASAVTAGTSYVWVLRRGNPGLAGVSTIQTDGTVAAHEALYPSSNDGRWQGRIFVSNEATSTTVVHTKRWIGFSRVADTAASLITSPALVEIDGYRL